MVGQRNVTGSIVVALGLLLSVWETVREHDDVIIAPPRGGNLPVGRISHVSAKKPPPDRVKEKAAVSLHRSRVVLLPKPTSDQKSPWRRN